ncbi:hypothetical protein Q6A78_07490 [Aliarcobacter skirrowii]|uniref:TnsA endonuclease N-terminal domain-containing protein n=1 Tax=Aliarcobacter skirrowii TaxID=28200 RepID=UPI0029AEC44F|nr:TnsA endonuclease N-terminal domain-containing protein [Aliarcobacter skirrowii]MDX3960248.1 hypothetical protein [Aliarcobacter skirrowii]
MIIQIKIIELNIKFISLIIVNIYQEQPQIEIFLNGKNQIYSADCYIKRSKNSLKKDSIVEVKYTNELEKKKDYFENKFEAASISADNLDFLYRYNY